MSAVLRRAELAESPLADLHLLANELGVDGYRRLRRDDLIEAILARQGGEAEGAAPVAEPTAAEAPAPAEAPPAAEAPAAAEAAAPAEAPADEDLAAGEDLIPTVGAAAEGAEPAVDVLESAPATTPEVEETGLGEDEPLRGRRGRRGGRGRSRARGADGDAPLAAPEATQDEAPAAAEDPVVEGVVELLANGSGFVRLTPPDASDEDVYVSAAQVKRCELVSGDRVSGPVRAPRRSERFPSLIRVDTINGRPAEEVAEGTRFEELPVAFPAERLTFGSEDPTVQAVEWLTPIGRGSRAVITGPALAGKSELLRRLAAGLQGQEGLEVTVVLAGVRPEEVADWPEPLAALSFAASSDAQAQAVEGAVEQGRRVAARGGHAVVVVDTLDYLPPAAARRALAAARSLAGGGSLTIVATASEPLGGESTVVALDRELTAMRRFPAIDLSASGTLRPELLVGDAGAEAIARARAEAGLADVGLGGDA